MGTLFGFADQARAPSATATPTQPDTGSLFATAPPKVEIRVVPEAVQAQQAPAKAEPIAREVTGTQLTSTQLSAKPNYARPALDVGVLNFRLILATLAQTYSGKNNMAVVNAQGEGGPVALSINSGTVALRDLHWLSTVHGRPPRPDGSLAMPVIVHAGATLRLEPGDHLGLARDAGAFVIALGTLDIDGATIEVTGDENPVTPSFVPFVTVAQGGSLIARDAVFRDLGFGQTAKFSGVSVVSDLLHHAEGTVRVEDSLFEGIQTVSIQNVPGIEMRGNTFLDPRRNALHLRHAPDAQLDGNLFAGQAEHNAIRVDKGSHRVSVARNILLNGERVAIYVNGGVDHARIQGNLVWNRGGAGVKFLDATCGLARGNYIIGNAQKGIEVRKSDGVVVTGNLLARNGSAGVWVSAQGDAAQTRISDNVFRQNGAGLSTATGAEILLARNDFGKQLPRLLDGDIARLTPAFATDLHGAKSLSLLDGEARTRDKIGTLCGSAS